MEEGTYILDKEFLDKHVRNMCTMSVEKALHAALMAISNTPTAQCNTQEFKAKVIEAIIALYKEKE